MRLDVTGTRNPFGAQTLLDLSGRFIGVTGGRSLSGFDFRVEESNDGGVANGDVTQTGVVSLDDTLSPTGLSFSAVVTASNGGWVSVDEVVPFADQYVSAATKGF